MHFYLQHLFKETLGIEGNMFSVSVFLCIKELVEKIFNGFITKFVEKSLWHTIGCLHYIVFFFLSNGMKKIQMLEIRST